MYFLVNASAPKRLDGRLQMLWLAQKRVFAMVYHQLKSSYILFMGGDLEVCGAFIGTPAGTSPSVLLNASCHKKHQYIWFMGVNLNSSEILSCL